MVIEVGIVTPLGGMALESLLQGENVEYLDLGGGDMDVD